MTETHYGHCLCGKVTFSIIGDLVQPIACHCTQCRQWSGHYWVSTYCDRDQFTFKTGEDHVKWYNSSDFARRGFCDSCGSSLFYETPGIEKWKHLISISASCFDNPTGLKLREHIFCADKGDYYDITDDLPQKAQH